MKYKGEKPCPVKKTNPCNATALIPVHATESAVSAWRITQGAVNFPLAFPRKKARRLMTGALHGL